MQVFSEIRTTIPGRDKRPASAGADQPHERLREELTSYDYCEGKLLTHEKKRSINKGQNFACISVGADQPRKQLCEELTNHDYFEGKLLTHEKKSINIGLYFAYIFVGNLLVITHLVRFIFLFINETSSLPIDVSYFDDLIIFMKKFF